VKVPELRFGEDLAALRDDGLEEFRDPRGGEGVHGRERQRRRRLLGGRPSGESGHAGLETAEARRGETAQQVREECGPPLFDVARQDRDRPFRGLRDRRGCSGQVQEKDIQVPDAAEEGPEPGQVGGKVGANAFRKRLPEEPQGGSHPPRRHAGLMDEFGVQIRRHARKVLLEPMELEGEDLLHGDVEAVFQFHAQGLGRIFGGKHDAQPLDRRFEFGRQRRRKAGAAGEEPAQGLEFGGRPFLQLRLHLVEPLRPAGPVHSPGRKARRIEDEFHLRAFGAPDAVRGPFGADGDLDEKTPGRDDRVDLGTDPLVGHGGRIGGVALDADFDFPPLGAALLELPQALDPVDRGVAGPAQPQGESAPQETPIEGVQVQILLMHDGQRIDPIAVRTEELQYGAPRPRFRHQELVFDLRRFRAGRYGIHRFLFPSS